MDHNFTYRLTYGLDQIKDAYDVRMDVFVSEQGFSEDLEKDAQDAASYHLVIFDEKKAVATARCFLYHDDIYKIGRVAVRKEYRGRDVGLLLMHRLEQELRELGCESVLISAQVQAIGFYEKAGYTPFGEEYFDEHCPHKKMKKIL